MHVVFTMPAEFHIDMTSRKCHIVRVLDQIVKWMQECEVFLI